MNYLPFVIFAYFLNAVAVTADKFLLTKIIPSPLVYVFYFSLVSSLALILLPLTHTPSLPVFILASISTLSWTLAAYLMFKALTIGQVWRVIPLIGTLTPLILLIQASASQALSLNQTWAVGILILGLIFLTIQSWQGRISQSELMLEVASAIFFAASYILLRQAYLQQDFLTVLIWSRLTLIPVGIVLLVIRPLRQKIFTPHGFRLNFSSPSGRLFLAGQTAGGLAELLLTFAISLATPALVNSLQGVQYVFILIFSLILSRKFPKIFQEKQRSFDLLLKLLGILLLLFGLYILNYQPTKPQVNIGVTFSDYYASSLGLNPKIAFNQLLDQLGVKLIRLPIYWDQVEHFPSQTNFSQIDYYLNQAEQRQAKIILVLGYKQPRWPECFAPDWVKAGTRAERSQKILSLVKKEISHFKQFKNIIAWQIENEPFFGYGPCDQVSTLTEELVREEVAIVKAQDRRPVIITDSGELGNWLAADSMADILGITVYRQVWNPVLGVQRYPWPPIFYNLKEGLIKAITNRSNPIIISELQAEPWFPAGSDPKQVKIASAKLLSVKSLAANLAYAKQTGASTILLWGVEWWLFMADHNHPEYLEFAKTIF